MAEDTCIHEANPNGGFAKLHGRLCGYSLDCFQDAEVHVRVVDRGWCANVCDGCAKKIGQRHRLAIGQLRGLEVAENA